MIRGMKGLPAIASGIACVVALMVISAAASATGPKPWQWTPEKMAMRLITVDVFRPQGLPTEHANCVGQSRSAAGRFSAFRCRIANDNPNYQTFVTDILTRVLPAGSGKFCIVATPPAFDGQRKAVPYKTGTLGFSVLPSRACP
jgi:hypothetical protein